MSESLMKVREVADYLGVSPKVVREHVSKGSLNAVNVGTGRRKVWRFRRPDVTKFEASRTARVFVPTRNHRQDGGVLSWV